MLWLLSATVLAHVGGIPTQADFQNPRDLGQVGDQSYSIVWTDNEQDMTGRFDFYYQPSNVTPAALLGTETFVGTQIAGAQGIMILDTANVFEWDTSVIPSGSYYVYEITVDEGLPPIYSVSGAPVTIQHGGDPRWPAVVVDEPNGVGDTQPSAFAVKWRGTADGPLTATVRFRDFEKTREWEEIASGVTMNDDGSGTQHGCTIWNLSLLPQGNYYVQVEVSDGQNTHSSYSRAMVVVYRDPDQDAGVPPSCESAPGVDGGARDGGSGGMGEDGPACGCRVGGRSGVTGGAALALVGLLAMRRRRYRALQP